MLKTVILAGGYGTRISEETQAKPKPMVEDGGQPLLWHIMKIYASFGVKDFIICLGYKGYVIKEFFLNYYLHLSDLTIDVATGAVDFHRRSPDNWRVTLVETGLDTMTGGRIKRVKDYIGDGDFFLTYGDGVADIDIDALLAFHRAEGRLATVTAVAPPARFGALDIEESRVTRFHEKPFGDGMQINAGFFVLSSKVIDYITDDMTSWELDPLERLAREGQLSAYRHPGFWHPVDTLRDKQQLEALWSNGKAPWKRW
jgi:glucose-1-phosphate cytidylyltransferase